MATTTVKHEKELEKLYDFYPETVSYQALVARRSSQQNEEKDDGKNDEESLVDVFMETKRDINSYCFLLSDHMPLICTTLGHAIADAEPIPVLSALVSAGADPTQVMLPFGSNQNRVTDEAKTLTAEQMVAMLKRQHSKEHAQFLLTLTGNTLDKGYYKAAAKFFKDHQKQASAFVDGMKVGVARA